MLILQCRWSSASVAFTSNQQKCVDTGVYHPSTALHSSQADFSVKKQNLLQCVWKTFHTVSHIRIRKEFQRFGSVFLKLKEVKISTTILNGSRSI